MIQRGYQIKVDNGIWQFIKASTSIVLNFNWEKMRLYWSHINKSQSDNNSCSTFLPGHCDVQLRQMSSTTFCAFFVGIKLNSVVALPWHGVTGFCSTFAVDIPRPDKWHLVRIVLTTSVNQRVVDCSIKELQSDIFAVGTIFASPPDPASVNQDQLLHTIAKHISRPQDIPSQFPFVRQQNQIQDSGVIYCPLPLSAQPMFFELNTAAICRWTDRDFSPHRVACIAQLRWPGMVPTLTLDGVVRCEQNVHSCALHYAHNFRAQFEIRLRDGDILLSHGQQWRMLVRSSAALRVRWIVATLSSYDWCLCPTKKIQ